MSVLPRNGTLRVSLVKPGAKGNLCVMTDMDVYTAPHHARCRVTGAIRHGMCMMYDGGQSFPSRRQTPTWMQFRREQEDRACCKCLMSDSGLATMSLEPTPFDVTTNRGVGNSLFRSTFQVTTELPAIIADPARHIMYKSHLPSRHILYKSHLPSHHPLEQLTMRVFPGKCP
jgi:hypothetical protein